MPLTDTAIRTAKPAERRQTLFDGGGLYLVINPNGSKLWRLKYRFEKKEKLLSFGAYPAIGLKDARERRDEARKLLAHGVDPGAARKAQKRARQELAVNSFEAIAREWFAVWRADKAESHSSKVIVRLEKDVFPWIGGRPIAELSENAQEVLSVLRRIESRGTLDTAHRAGGNCSQVFRYAIATGRAKRDPIPDLRGALPPVRGSHFAALVEPAKVAELLRSIEGFKGTHWVRAALALAPLVFVRPAELREAKWADIDLEKAEWRYIASKTRTAHLVPLAMQAVAILRDLHPLTGHHEYAFPGRDPKRAISTSTLQAALQRMGYDTKTEMTGHGFRAMARTLLAEELHFPPEIIEHQLAHSVPDTLGTAYNRTKFLKERKAMMQCWADYLDKLKAGADIVPIRPAA
jgi:integrase